MNFEVPSDACKGTIHADISGLGKLRVDSQSLQSVREGLKEAPLRGLALPQEALCNSACDFCVLFCCMHVCTHFVVPSFR